MLKIFNVINIMTNNTKSGWKLPNYEGDLYGYVNRIKKNEIRYIYGGVTTKDIQNCYEQHIETNPIMQLHKLFKPHKSFEISKILSIQITNKMSLVEWTNLIKNLETFLINELYKKFNSRCINENKNGNGNENENDKTFQIKYGDIFMFYVMYKK